MELHERRGSQVSALVISAHHGAGVGVLCQGGHVVDVAVTTGTQDDGVAGEGLELTSNQVAGDNAARALLAVVIVGDDVLHIVVGKKLHIAQADLTVQCRGRGQLQLLTCLATGVVGTGDLHTTEGTGGQGAAVLTGERGADGVHVVDNTNGLVGQAPAVGLAAAVVATLHGVLGVAVSGVIVHLLGAGGVDTTLRSNGVRAAWGVVVGKDLDAVAQFTKGCRSSTRGQAGTYDEDLELAAVQWGDQVHVVNVVRPHILHRHTVRFLGFQDITSGDALNDGLWVREVGVFTLEFSSSHGFLSPLADQAQGNGQRHNDVADAYNGRDDVRQDQEGLTPFCTGDTQVRCGKADAVGQVQEEAAHCQHVEDGDRPTAKGFDHIGLNRAFNESLWGHRLYAHGEVQQVEDDEEQQHDTSYQHGLGGEGIQATHQVGALELAAGCLGAGSQGKGTVDVGKDCHDQHDADDPQGRAVRQQRFTHRAQELAVLIQGRLTVVCRHVQLQVAGHVADHEKRKEQTGNGHDELQYPRWRSGLLTNWFISDVAVSDCLTVRIS